MARRALRVVSGSTQPADLARGATIRDVARLAGVSVGTVSRGLHLHPPVPPTTRQKVLATMAHLRYEPSQVARSLSLKRTLSIAVVVPFITTASVVERLRGTMDAIEDTEYDLVIYNVETVRSRQRYFRSLPRRERVDGVIVFSLAPTPEEETDFLSAGMPVVLVDASSTRLPCVVVDDLAGGEMSTRHLIELGHRRICFVGDEYPHRFGFGFHY